MWLIELHGNGGREAIELLSGAGYVIELLNVEERRTHNEHVLAHHAAS